MKRVWFIIIMLIISTPSLAEIIKEAVIDGRRMVRETIDNSDMEKLTIYHENDAVYMEAIGQGNIVIESKYFDDQGNRIADPANDAAAQSHLRGIIIAAERYAENNNGAYPNDISQLTEGENPYLPRSGNWCGKTRAGFRFECECQSSGCFAKATPFEMGISGSQVFEAKTK